MNVEYKKRITDDGYVSTVPLPTAAELQKFYADTYYQTPKSVTYQDSYDALEIDYKNLKCAALIHALSKFASFGARTFLDVGAGEGFLLNAANNSNFEVTGLDFSDYGVKKFFPNLASKHVAGDVFESLAKLLVEGKRFSICTSTNVLEHVLDPDVFMQSIREIVKPNGLVAITVPNDYSYTQQLALQEGMVDREFWYVPPEHLNYFNTENLVRFMEDRRFEVMDAFSDFPIDLYLLHSGSNYIMNPTKGREANKARMQHDIMIARKNGFDKYLEYYRAMFKVGLGRNITIIVRPI
jgi:2-polyprenyl-3-methyl-5-hydroxy-6-metoxy-1,4-benzoquinol methylase